MGANGHGGQQAEGFWGLKLCVRWWSLGKSTSLVTLCASASGLALLNNSEPLNRKRSTFTKNSCTSRIELERDEEEKVQVCHLTS